MRQTVHRFLKGINRRFSILFSDDPERVYTLQNARLIKRGQTGFITRIKGYLQWFSPKKYEKPFELLAVKGKVDTSKYKKGYKISFVDSVVLNESSLTPFNNVDKVFIQDSFLSWFIENQKYLENIDIVEQFRIYTLKQFSFVDIVNVNDQATIPNRTTISFVDNIQMTDFSFYF